jgi:hypothetical protein
MGWLSFSMHRPVKDWYKSELNSKFEVLDSALVERTTFYAAVKDKETGQVFCDVLLIRWAPKSWDNFAYKDIGEFSGPVQCNCPKRIMKLLSPLNDENDPNGWAREWRKKVEKYWESRNTINSGCVLKSEEPISFTSGMDYQYFQKMGRSMWAGVLEENKFRPICRVRVNLNRFNLEKVSVKSLVI